MRKTLFKRISKLLKSRKLFESLFLVTALLIIYSALYFFAQSVEPNMYDIMIKTYTQVTAKDKSIADDKIIMVLIDNESIDKIGRWPWPRNKYIELFDYLKNTGKAKVIAFDSVIKGIDKWNPESDEYFFSNLKHYKNLRIGLDFRESPQKHFGLSEPTLLQKIQLTNITDNRKNKELIGIYDLSEEPFIKLIENTAGFGSVLSSPDPDNTIRSVAYILYYKGNYYPSLSLSSILEYYGETNPDITINEDNIIIKLKEKTITIPTENDSKPYINKDLNKNFFSKSIDKIITPFYKKNNVKLYNKTKLKWYSPQQYQTYTHSAISAYKIINAYNTIKSGKKSELNPHIFKDKIVIIGSNVTGITSTGITDIKGTPLFPYHPGVDIQATCIDNLLNSDFMKKISPKTNLYISLGMVLLVILLIIIFHDVYLTILTVLCLAMTYFFVTMFWLYPNNISVDIATPIIYIIITPMIIYTYRFFIEKQKRGLLLNVFGKLVSSDVMSELLKDPEEIDMGGKREEITILFADIRGFTTLSEKLSPEEISNILNEYFNKMEPVIKRNKGTLDKYMGDAIMAIFGAPVNYPDHYLLAAKAALDMQEELTKLQEKWRKQGKPTFEIGIGINTGICFVGKVGSKEHIQYTAIGDAVNIASRLEQLNKNFNTSVIISQYTYEKIRQFVEVKSLGKEKLKGKSEEVMIYELKGVRDLKDFAIRNR